MTKEELKAKIDDIVAGAEKARMNIPADDYYAIRALRKCTAKKLQDLWDE